MESVWGSYMYAMFGFLYINIFLMCLVICCLAVVSVYLQIINKKWNWWWRTFHVGASAGIYVAIYTLYYMIFHLKANLIGSEMIYLIYMYVFTICFSLMCGTIGVLSGLVFVELVYRDV